MVVVVVVVLSLVCSENSVAVAAFQVILQRCSLAKLLRQIFTEYVIVSLSVSLVITALTYLMTCLFFNVSCAFTL